MAEVPTRYGSAPPAQVAEGWSLERLTPPSRLYGANGMRTGSDGRIYVAQVAGSQISAVDPDSGEVAIVSPMGGAIVGPDDLAFDESGNIYATEITENRVSMLAPDGTSRVIQGDMPVANPITWHQGRLIAGECRIGARIMELDLNGGAPRVIIDNLPMTNAFEVGPDGKLYFPVMGTNEIWRIDLGGGEPEVVAGGLGVPDAVKFHPDGYIVSTQVASGQVLRIDPASGAQTVLADIGPGLDNLAFVGKRIFASHITGSIDEIVAPGQTRPLLPGGLGWPLGLALGEDGRLFVADGMFAFTLRPGEGLAPAGMMFTPGYPGWARAAAAAGPGTWIVTTANGDVVRWYPAEQRSETLASGFDRLMGVAASPAGALVVAEAGTGRLLSLEGGNVAELATDLAKPMGVAVAADGAVLVAESHAGRILRIAGGGSEVLIDGLGQPEGIAIAGDRLAIVDVRTKQVIECDLAGGERRILASGLPVGAPPGVPTRKLGGVGDMCGPMWSFAGIAADGAGTLFVSGDAEGSVLALRRTRTGS